MSDRDLHPPFQCVPLDDERQFTDRLGQWLEANLFLALAERHAGEILRLSAELEETRVVAVWSALAN